MKMTPGGLVQMWHRLADLLFAWQEQIHAESLGSAKRHADEIGWRVQGKTYWLWCFASDDSVFYLIDHSRGSPAPQTFFTTAFEGTLITDFWSPYKLSPASVIRPAVGFPRPHTSNRLDLTGFSLGSTGARLPI